MLRGRRLALLFVPFALAWGLLGYLPRNPTDRDGFFLPAAWEVLTGHPLDIYKVRYDDIYPNANGPLGIYALAGASALARVVGAFDDVRARKAWLIGLLSLFTFWAAVEAVRSLERLRGDHLGKPWQQVGAFVLFGFSPLAWVAAVASGHDEEPLALASVLFAARWFGLERYLWSGVAIGAALLSKTSTLVFAMPLFAVLFARRDWLNAGRVAAGIAVPAAAGFAPFFAARFDDTFYSLVAYRAKAELLGGGLWGCFLGTPVEAVAMRVDGLSVLIAALGVSYVLARRLNVAGNSPEVYGLLALAGLAFPLLIRSSWAYHFFAPSALALVWALSRENVLSRAGALAVGVPVWILFTALVSIRVYILTGDGPMTAGRSLVMTVCIVIGITLLVWQLLSAPRADAVSSRPAG